MYVCAWRALGRGGGGGGGEDVCVYVHWFLCELNVEDVKVAGAVQLFRGLFDHILTAFLSLSARWR